MTLFLPFLLIHAGDLTNSGTEHEETTTPSDAILSCYATLIYLENSSVVREHQIAVYGSPARRWRIPVPARTGRISRLARAFSSPMARPSTALIRGALDARRTGPVCTFSAISMSSA
ncbi:hypothetical protein BDZ89DRAFT_1137320 [Hymenopellis radicata]|nr:hypothetical protein BDZ89DRAFT_1137320 [Hymenopellis radicata]